MKRRPLIMFRTGWQVNWWGRGSGTAARALTVVVLLAASAGLIVQAALLWQSHEAARRQLESLLAQRDAWRDAAPPEISSKDTSLSSEDGAQRALAVGQLNTPWSDIFDGLEQAAHPDVGLLSLEPDSGKHSLRVQAEAKEVGDLLTYAARLNQSAGVGMLLLRQQETNEQDLTRPARLGFEVKLRASDAPPAGAAP